MKKLSGIQKKVQNIKWFINKCNYKGISYPSKIIDWKTFKKTNPTIALNIPYIKKKRNMLSLYLKN